MHVRIVKTDHPILPCRWNRWMLENCWHGRIVKADHPILPLIARRGAGTAPRPAPRPCVDRMRCVRQSPLIARSP